MTVVVVNHCNQKPENALDEEKRKPKKNESKEEPDPDNNREL